MDDRSLARQRGIRRLVREPLVHFFIVGALLFAASRLWGDDSRHITVPANLKADLGRRFHDDRGRPPTAAEQAELFRTWQRDEALYREALRRNWHQSDTNVRAILVGKMQAAAQLEVPIPQPSEAELEGYLRSHPEKYALPRRYDFQVLTFAKAEPDAEAALGQALAALGAGAPPASLGRPVRGGKLTAEDLPSRVAAPVAARIVQLTPGGWQRVEGETDLWLVRVQAILGGLPEFAAVRQQVLIDWTKAAQAEDVDRELQKTIDLYTFEEVERGK